MPTYIRGYTNIRHHPSYTRGELAGWDYLQCSACGALVANGPAREDHDRYHETMISRKEAERMSTVKWCDVGDHAFRGTEDGSQSFVVTVYDAVNERNVQQSMDACGKHAVNTRITQARVALTATDEPTDN